MRVPRQGHRSFSLMVLSTLIVSGATFAALSTTPPGAVAAFDFSFDLGPEEYGLPPETQLGSYPDAHVSLMRTDTGISMWFSAEVRGYLFHGPDLESLQPYRTAANGDPVPVLIPSGSGFDSEYAAFGSVLPGPAANELLGFYHAETCDRDNFTATIGLARSADGGASWQRLGQVISGRNSDDSCAKTSPRGAGQPSAVRIGEYLYLYYTDWGGDIPDQIHLARAPFRQATESWAWQKYHEGSFSRPGIGGDSTPVISRPEPVEQGVYAANASVSYNTYLRRYLTVFGANNGFWATTSVDGIAWDAPRQIPVAFPQMNDQIRPGDLWYGYVSFLSPDQPTHLTTGQTGYLYYARGVWQVDSHKLVRRAITLRAGGTPAAPTPPPAPWLTDAPFPTPRPAATPRPSPAAQPRRQRRRYQASQPPST
jgi:hypothetical protein